MRRRTPRPFHRLSAGHLVECELLESRRLLATGFNPDGPTIATPADAPTSVITADFDGDAKPDLVTSVGQDIIFQKGTGGGRFGAPRVLMHLNTAAGLLGVGDFNQDGLNDLFSVEKETSLGWYRLLLNNGQANFSIASYGRSLTIVESVTVGNIDGDAQDEVLLEGRALLLTSDGFTAEPLDEIRVLDPNQLRPITSTSGRLTANLLPFLRFNDLGRAVFGARFTTPVIAHMLDGAANQIVVGSKDVGGNDGFIQIYAFAAPSIGNPGPLGLPPPLFTPLTGGIATTGMVSSVAVADMNGDAKPDIVAATLTAPTLPMPFTFEAGSFAARTVVLPRSGDLSMLVFDAPETVEERVILGPGANERRMAIPEYRIATVSDINSDGRMDVGLSIAQEFAGNDNFRRVGRFVQATRDEGNVGFNTLIVAQITARTGLADFSIARTQIFYAADVRRVGRPDLIIATPRNSSGFTPITIRYNVQAFTIIPF